MTVLRGLDARLRLARLCLVTDGREQQGDLAEFLGAAFAGGVDLVQLRPPGLTPACVEVARQAAASVQVLVGLRESLALAAEVQVDVVHLVQPRETSAAARRHLHPYALLGRSVHDERELAAALADDDVDYLTVGPVYGVPPDLELVRHAAAAAPVYAMSSKPWFAVGGITADNLSAVLEAGAGRICVSRALTWAADPRATARTFAAALREAWRSDPAAERYTFAAAASPGRRR